VTTPDAAPEPARTPVEGWRGLARALRPRATPAQALTGVLCVMLGFAIAVQVRQTDTASLSTMRESELVSLLDQTTRQADELQDQVSELERTQQELRSGSSSREAALDAATRSAAAQGILSGRLPAEGPGVEIEVVEGAEPVSGVRLFNVLEELRNAGAEAMEVNGVRLVASSYFEDTSDGVVVGGETGAQGVEVLAEAGQIGLEVAPQADALLHARQTCAQVADALFDGLQAGAVGRTVAALAEDPGGDGGEVAFGVVHAFVEAGKDAVVELGDERIQVGPQRAQLRPLSVEALLHAAQAFLVLLPAGPVRPEPGHQVQALPQAVLRLRDDVSDETWDHGHGGSSKRKSMPKQGTVPEL